MSRVLHDGHGDGLTALEPLHLEATEDTADLLQRMSRTAFGGRDLGEAFEVFRAMTSDPDCTIILTISGAMTVAKMGRVICTMLERGWTHLLVSTGALMAHGLSEAIGGIHYKYDPAVGDRELYDRGYNRVYDTLEMEANLCEAERMVSDVLDGLDWSQPKSSHEIHHAIGRRLHDDRMMPSVLGVAYQKSVPVYVPAFTDSELGLDVATHALKRRHRASEESDLAAFFSGAPAFNPYLDLFDFARRVLSAGTIGIFTIGGGVPRNWGQQLGPLADIINMRLGTQLRIPRIRYGVRICPEPVHWGGLSGCTYSEGVSWGKFLSPAEGGRFAEVRCDATIAWPLLVRGLLDLEGDGAAGSKL